jgi:hypothetical protein
MSDRNDDASTPPPGFTPPPRAPVRGAGSPRFAKAYLWILGVALAAGGAFALANAA